MSNTTPATGVPKRVITFRRPPLFSNTARAHVLYKYKDMTIEFRDGKVAKVDKYRFQQMFPTRSEAIEALLDWAVKQSPSLKPKGQ